MSNASLELGGTNWAAKDGNLLGYAVGDSSGKYVPREFTFTRGSNLAATRVAANGLIEKGRENLLLQSNQFDTTWTRNNLSVTSGQSGYDGSSDAWLLNTTIANGFLRRDVSFSGVSTFSIYAKAGTADGIYIEFAASTFPNLKVNLSSQSFISSTNIIDYNIEDVGNGWSRVSFTISGSHIRVNIKAIDNLGAVTDGTLYIQDAQLEQGMVATGYIETGATTVQAGLLEAEPRIDYTGGTGSLLLEPSRTNLVEYSEYFEGTGWTAQSGITLTANTTETLSPEGLNNAYKVVSTDATKGFYFSGLSITNAAVRTIYLKGSVGGETIVFKDPSGFGTPSTKTLSTDWQRFEIATTNDGNTYQGLFIDDISVGTIYAFGAQMEEGSYPTSYIPNHSGGSVTRSNDDATLTYSNNFNDITIFAEVNSEDVVRDSSAQNIQVGNDFSQGGAFFLRRSSNTSTKRLLAFFLNNDNTSVFSSYELPEDNSKVAFKYNSTSNACKLFVNGSEVRSGTATDITEFDSFRLNGSGGKFNSKQLVVFNTELSDAACITLTTL